MEGSSQDLSIRTGALVAGFGLLIEAVISPVALLYIFPRLVDPANAASTASHLRGSAGLFGVALAILLVVVILDLVVAWGLYIFFRPANKSVAQLTAGFRVLGAILSAVALGLAAFAFQLANRPAYAAGLTPDQTSSQVLLALGGFQSVYDLALVFFGVHLLVLGYLVVDSGYLSRRWGYLLGALVGLAGLGYVSDNVGKLLVPGYGPSISSFTFVGEVVLLLWLLVWGARGRLAGSSGARAPPSSTERALTGTP